MKKGRTVKQAVELFESFRERKPTRIGRVTLKVPTVVAAMGYVEGIDYRTTHGKKTELYHHDFAPGSRPLLAVSADGRQILLLGGRYKWTERGIVDRDRNDREIKNEGHGKMINPRPFAVADAKKDGPFLLVQLIAARGNGKPVRYYYGARSMAQAEAMRDGFAKMDKTIGRKGVTYSIIRSVDSERKENPARQVIDGAALAKMLSAELKAVKAGKIPVRTPAQDALMAQYAAALRSVARKGNPKPASATLQKIMADPRVDDVSDERDDGDGVWIYLKPGYINDSTDTGTIHESTWSNAYKVLRAKTRES